MRATNEPAPAAAEGPELRPGLGLAVGPLPEPGPVGQRGLHVHPVEAPRHHGQQQYHGGQETREPERVVAHGLQRKVDEMRTKLISLFGHFSKKITGEFTECRSHQRAKLIVLPPHLCVSQRRESPPSGHPLPQHYLRDLFPFKVKESQIPLQAPSSS